MNVVIDGVRYVPASEAAAGLDDLRKALEDVFWSGGYNPHPEILGYRSQGLFVRVHDDGDGTPLNDFMDEMAASVASSASS